MALNIAAKETCNIHIEAPSIGLNSNYTIQKGTRTIAIDDRITVHGPGIWRNGVHVTSDKDIRIYAISKMTSTSDGFLVLPYSSLSTQYYVGSYTPLQKSEFIIAAAYDSTSVTVTFKFSSGHVTFRGRSYSNGQKATFTLDRLQVAQIQHDHDLTGTYIESSKATAVVSGNDCANVPVGERACDVLLSYMPPLPSWNKRYITAAFKTRLHNRIRIISGSDGNTVKIGNLNTITLKKGQFSEQVFTQDVPVLIDCSDPCLLLQYAEGTLADHRTGDPSMTLVPSLDHLDSDFYFKTPHMLDNYLTIVIRSAEVSGLRLDGSAINGEEKTIMVTEHGRSEVIISSCSLIFSTVLTFSCNFMI